MIELLPEDMRTTYIFRRRDCLFGAVLIRDLPHYKTWGWEIYVYDVGDGPFCGVSTKSK